jgi:hypothetical protein
MKNSDAHKEMHPKLYQRVVVWEYLMLQKGLRFCYTSVGRLFQVQFALYAQGREDSTRVNMYRKLAGLPSISLAESNRIVTWTMNSLHIINLKDNNKANDLSRAFDFALLDKNGKAHWDVKADVNVDNQADYVEAGHLLEEAVLTAGAFFKDAKGNPRPDYPHAQLTIHDLKEIGAL